MSLIYWTNERTSCCLNSLQFEISKVAVARVSRSRLLLVFLETNEARRREEQSRAEHRLVGLTLMMKDPVELAIHSTSSNNWHQSLHCCCCCCCCCCNEMPPNPTDSLWWWWWWWPAPMSFIPLAQSIASRLNNCSMAEHSRRVHWHQCRWEGTSSFFSLSGLQQAQSNEHREQLTEREKGQDPRRYKDIYSFVHLSENRKCTPSCCCCCWVQVEGVCSPSSSLTDDDVSNAQNEDRNEQKKTLVAQQCSTRIFITDSQKLNDTISLAPLFLFLLAVGCGNSRSATAMHRL